MYAVSNLLISVAKILDVLLSLYLWWFPWTAMGGIDFAPMIIMLGIFFIQSFVVQTLIRFAYNLAR